MDNHQFSATIKNFIHQYIESLGELEVLLFLQSHASKSWTAQEIAQEFRSNDDMASQQLEKLTSKGLVKRLETMPLGYTYFPKDESLRQSVEQLRELYTHWRFTITNMIYDRPVDKMRDFAKAFKFTKD